MRNQRETMIAIGFDASPKKMRLSRLLPPMAA